MDLSELGDKIIVIISFVGSFPNRIQALRTQSLVTPRGSQRNHFEIPERSFAAFSARTLLLAIPGAHILRELLQRRQVFDCTRPHATARLQGLAARLLRAPSLQND